MIVTLDGSSGLTKAYRSVLSAAGSPAICGASRWLEASAPPPEEATMASAPARAATRARVDTGSPLADRLDPPSAGPCCCPLRRVATLRRVGSRWMRGAGAVGSVLDPGEDPA